MVSDFNLFPIFERQGRSRTRFKVGYIARGGGVVLAPVFDDGTGFHEGLAAVKTGRYWGLIDLDGTTIVEPTLPNWCHFSEGLGNLCTAKGNWGVIDKLGRFVVEPKYAYVGGYKNGLAVFRIGKDDAGRFGFLDKIGIDAIDERITNAGSFSEGLAAVMVNNCWG